MPCLTQRALPVEKMVYVLERDHADLKVCHTEFKKHNPLIPYVKLFAGIIRWAGLFAVAAHARH